MTFERGNQVLNTQCDGRSPKARLEGLMMAMADFHVQMNFLKMIYDTLFKVIILLLLYCHLGPELACMFSPMVHLVIYATYLEM